jgi:hypothetical protein
LFQLAEGNLAPFAPIRHRLNVAEFLGLLKSFRSAISTAEPKLNPWSPVNAPRVQLQ